MCTWRPLCVMQVSIFVEEGRHSFFTLAHHPYCMPAELRSLEVHLRGEKCNTGSFLYLDLRTTEQPNVGCTEQLFCLLPCLQQPCKFMLCIAKDHVSLSAMSWLIFHFQLQSILVILRQESGQMKTKTWSTKASFLDLHYSNYNKALLIKYWQYFSLMAEFSISACFWHRDLKKSFPVSFVCVYQCVPKGSMFGHYYVAYWETILNVRFLLSY